MLPVQNKGSYVYKSTYGYVYRGREGKCFPKKSRKLTLEKLAKKMPVPTVAPIRVTIWVLTNYLLRLGKLPTKARQG